MGTRRLLGAVGATGLAVLLLLAASGAATVRADPCGHEARRGCGCGLGGWRSGRFGRSYGRNPGHRTGCWDSLHEDRFVARGQGWQLLRRYLHRVRIQNEHVHPSYYFQRRWPCRAAGAPRGWGGLECVGHDFPVTECPLVAAALGGDGEPTAGMREPTAADRLDRGMERCFRGAYEEAAEDFAFVAKADARDARARYGLLVCRVMRNDLRGAVAAMRELADLDALDARDRLELESTFQDPQAFESVKRGLDSLTQWSFHDVDAQLVAAWTHAVTGDEEGARTHVKAALRFAPKHAVATRLLATLDGEPQAEAPATPPATSPEARPDPLPAPRENVAARAD